MAIKKLHAAIALAAFTMASSPALAQNAASATANSSVTIIRPIVIAKTADLFFGRIVKPSTGSGTVTIANTSNTVTTSGAVALPGQPTSRAAFTITGEGAQAIDITVGSLVLTGPNGQTINVTLTPDIASGVALSGTLASEGTKVLNIGGNFALPSTQVTGLYSGSFDVNVAYQ